MTIHQMQDLSRSAMEYASKIIVSGMTLTELRSLCEEFMLSHGADSFWYWGVGAFIFSGDRTTTSVSGREYKTDDRQIKHNDLITIDLSPQRDSVWGDYARTLIVENGHVVKDIDCIQNIEWKKGLETEEHLHNAMLNFVNTDTTFEELFYFINDEIKACGYVNLDFLGNLGHSIVRDKNDRIYIEKGNNKKLSSVEAFTFEPHIGTEKSAYGFKKEDIYTFCNNKLIKL